MSGETRCPTCGQELGKDGELLATELALEQAEALITELLAGTERLFDALDAARAMLDSGDFRRREQLAALLFDLRDRTASRLRDLDRDRI